MLVKRNVCCSPVRNLRWVLDSSVQFGSWEAPQIQPLDLYDTAVFLKACSPQKAYPIKYDLEPQCPGQLPVLEAAWFHPKVHRRKVFPSLLMGVTGCAGAARVRVISDLVLFSEEWKKNSSSCFPKRVGSVWMCERCVHAKGRKQCTSCFSAAYSCGKAEHTLLLTWLPFIAKCLFLLRVMYADSRMDCPFSWWNKWRLSISEAEIR